MIYSRKGRTRLLDLPSHLVQLAVLIDIPCQSPSQTSRFLLLTLTCKACRYLLWYTWQAASYLGRPSRSNVLK